MKLAVSQLKSRGCRRCCGLKRVSSRVRRNCAPGSSAFFHHFEMSRINSALRRDKVRPATSGVTGQREVVANQRLFQLPAALRRLLKGPKLERKSLAAPTL